MQLRFRLMRVQVVYLCFLLISRQTETGVIAPRVIVPATSRSGLRTLTYSLIARIITCNIATVSWNLWEVWCIIYNTFFTIGRLCLFLYHCLGWRLAREFGWLPHINSSKQGYRAVIKSFGHFFTAREHLGINQSCTVWKKTNVLREGPLIIIIIISIFIMRHSIHWSMLMALHLLPRSSVPGAFWYFLSSLGSIQPKLPVRR